MGIEPVNKSNGLFGKEWEADYLRLLDRTSDAIGFHNEEGVFLYANPRTASIFGIEESGLLLGHSIWEYVDPDAKALLERQWLRLAGSSEQIGALEFEILSNDVANGPVEVSAVPFRFRNENAVQTFFKRREHHASYTPAHGDTHQWAETVLYELPSGLLEVDETGRIRFANRTARAMLQLGTETGYPELEDVFPPGDRLDGPVHSAGWSDGRFRGTDGEQIVVSTLSFWPGIDAPRILSLQTGRGPTYERRKKREEHLAIARKFSSQLRHEIRNPLASVLAGIQTLEAEVGGNPDNSFLFDLVLDSVRSLDALVNDLADASKVLIEEPMRIPVGRLITDVVSEAVRTSSKQSPVIESGDTDPEARITGDETALKRALTNVIINAVEACGPSDRVTVSARILTPEEKARTAPGFEGSIVTIGIRDTGKGLPHDLSPSSLFKPFVTTKARRSGLGLPVAQHIVEMMGGVVRIKTDDSGATNTEILLPGDQYVPCWIARHKASPDGGFTGENCVSCEVKRCGKLLFCWFMVGKAHMAETGEWLRVCRECAVFRHSNISWCFDDINA